MFGALIGGAVAQWGIPVTQHFSVTLMLIAVCGYFAATALPISTDGNHAVLNDEVKGDLQEDGAEEASKLFRWPARSIILLCLRIFLSGKFGLTQPCLKWSSGMNIK